MNQADLNASIRDHEHWLDSREEHMRHDSPAPAAPAPAARSRQSGPPQDLTPPLSAVRRSASASRPPNTPPSVAYAADMGLTPEAISPERGPDPPPAPAACAGTVNREECGQVGAAGQQHQPAHPACQRGQADRLPRRDCEADPRRNQTAAGQPSPARICTARSLDGADLAGRRPDGGQPAGRGSAERKVERRGIGARWPKRRHLGR